MGTTYVFLFVRVVGKYRAVIMCLKALGYLEGQAFMSEV